jgi:hypothetical protein
MIFNLFSTYRQILKPLDTIQTTNTELSTSSTFLDESKETFDPILKLLTDLKARKNNKVIVSTEQEVIKSIVNDKSRGSSIFVNVKKTDSPITFSKPTRLPALFRSQRAPSFPTAQNKLLLSKLNDIPVYVVVTNKKELITASPRSNKDITIGDWISTKYYNWFVWKEDEGPVSLGLFFMDKHSAEMYLQEICKNDPQGSEKVGVETAIVGLDKFYEMNRTSSPGFQVKLIADLEEMKKLILKYKKNVLYSLHPKQEHSKNNFQGTPIYIVKNAVGKSKITKKTVVIQYKIKDSFSKTNIFFRLTDVYSAWERLKNDNKTIEFPSNPQIEIYNLETYLLDCEKLSAEAVGNIRFLATQEAYKMFEEESQKPVKKQPTLSEELISGLSKKTKAFKDTCKRMLWLFTSDTLPTEDNGW